MLNEKLPQDGSRVARVGFPLRSSPKVRYLCLGSGSNLTLGTIHFFPSCPRKAGTQGRTDPRHLDPRFREGDGDGKWEPSVWFVPFRRLRAGRCVPNSEIARARNPLTVGRTKLGTGDNSPMPRRGLINRACLRRGSRRFTAGRIILLLFLALCCRAMPGEAEPPKPIAIELNRLEEQGANCRAYLVIANPGPAAFSGFTLDLVLFDRGGTITRRLAVDIAPVRPEKTMVKVFDIAGTVCGAIGSILVNDVLHCRDAEGDVAGCIDRITASSKLSVKLSKKSSRGCDAGSERGAALAVSAMRLPLILSLVGHAVVVALLLLFVAATRPPPEPLARAASPFSSARLWHNRKRRSSPTRRSSRRRRRPSRRCRRRNWCRRSRQPTHLRCPIAEVPVGAARPDCDRRDAAAAKARHQAKAEICRAPARAAPCRACRHRPGRLRRSPRPTLPRDMRRCHRRQRACPGRTPPLAIGR